MFWVWAYVKHLLRLYDNAYQYCKLDVIKAFLNSLLNSLTLRNFSSLLPKAYSIKIAF